MKRNFECKGEIAQLYYKFEYSIIEKQPITDSELRKLRDINWQIVELMQARGDNTMHRSFLLTAHDIERMIAARAEK